MTSPSSSPPVPVPDPDVREAVARWLLAHDGVHPAAWDRLLNDRGKAVWLRYADELLAVVGQASRADEALVDRFMARYLDGVGAFDSSNDELRDRAYVRSGLLVLVARPAVVQPAQPNNTDLTLRERPIT